LLFCFGLYVQSSAAMPGTIIDSGLSPAGSHIIILTFDDGPNASADVTSRLLDVLERHGIPAVFFFPGRRVLKHPELVRRASEAGHQVGAHGWFSGWPVWFDSEELAEELRRSRKAIEETTGRKLEAPLLYRPPRGLVTPAVRALVKACELRLGYLTFYARDSGASAADAERIMRRLREGVQEHRGGAVVLHSSRYRKKPRNDNRVDKSWLPEAVEAFIGWAQEQGYRFRTFPPTSTLECARAA